MLEAGSYAIEDGSPGLSSGSSARGTVALRVVAGIALLVSLVPNFGIVDLVTAIAPAGEWVPLRMLELGWAIVFGILFPVGFAAQLRRGGGPLATLQQLVVVTVSLGVATLLTTKPHEWLLVAFWAAATAAVVALHPARSRVLALGRMKAERALAALAALAVVPAGIYAAQMAAQRRGAFPAMTPTASSTGPSRARPRSRSSCWSG